jgi:hypothetical protein
MKRDRVIGIVGRCPSGVVPSRLLHDFLHDRFLAAQIASI